jgi:hypothetical protein
MLFFWPSIGVYFFRLKLRNNVQSLKKYQIITLKVLATPTNNGFNADLAVVCRFKIRELIEIPSFNYITSQQGQAG